MDDNSPSLPMYYYEQYGGSPSSGNSWANGHSGAWDGIPEPNGAPAGTLCAELEPAKQEHCRQAYDKAYDRFCINQPAEREHEAIVKALALCYSDASYMADALKQIKDMSEATYHNREEQHPDEINRHHAEAKAIATPERSGEQIAF